MSTPTDFFKAVAPVAIEISQMTKGNMIPETLLCQFADETGWHAEGVWEGKEGWSGKFNMAGVSPNGHIADYASYDDFAAAYVQVIDQNDFGFPAVLSADNPELQMVMLGHSGWAGSRYDAGQTGRPGIDLVNIFRNYKTEIEAALTEAKQAAAQKEAPVAEDPAPAQDAAPAAETPAPAQDAAPVAEEPAAPAADPQQPMIDALNDALHALGAAWGADEKGRDFYHAWAMQIRSYAELRGFAGVTVGA